MDDRDGRYVVMGMHWNPELKARSLHPGKPGHSCLSAAEREGRQAGRQAGGGSHRIHPFVLCQNVKLTILGQLTGPANLTAQSCYGSHHCNSIAMLQPTYTTGVAPKRGTHGRFHWRHNLYFFCDLSDVLSCLKRPQLLQTFRSGKSSEGHRA